ncbi:Kiwa anti-phage protein KwaB-like domain-containing protein [Alkalihalobacillus sp. NPDC078783]
MKDISKQILSQIYNADTVKIYFVNPQYNEENSYKVAKLNINDSVIEAAKEIISSCVQGFSEKEEIAIEKLDKQDEDYVVTVPLSEVDFLEECINDLKNERYESFHAHDSTDFLEKLKFYVLELSHNGESHYFIRRYSCNKLMAPRQVLLVRKENTFEHVKDNKVFTLETAIDAFVQGNKVFVLRDKQFSQMTGYYKKEREKADKVLNDIGNLNLVNGFDTLKEHCEQRISYVKKISKIDQSSVNKITFSKVLELKQSRGIDFVVDEGSKTISFESDSQLKNVLDLLLDNFLISEVTGEPYRALNKRKDIKTA